MSSSDDEEAAARLLRKAATEAERRAAAKRDARERREAAPREREAAAREELMHPPPEVERAREVGRAFVAAIGNMPRKRPRAARCRIGPKQKQRGWVLDFYAVPGAAGGRPVVVLDDGRVGHAAWKHSMGVPPYGIVDDPWFDLPWSEELEDRLAEWLARNGAVN